MAKNIPGIPKAHIPPADEAAEAELARAWENVFEEEQQTTKHFRPRPSLRLISIENAHWFIFGVPVVCCLVIGAVMMWAFLRVTGVIPD